MTDPCRKDEHTALIRRLRDPVASSETGREAADTIERLATALTEAEARAGRRFKEGIEAAARWHEHRARMCKIHQATQEQRGDHTLAASTAEIGGIHTMSANDIRALTPAAQPAEQEAAWVGKVREALEFYASPHSKKGDDGYLVNVPDFYSELSFGDRAQEALSLIPPPPAGEKTHQEEPARDR
jgi:hypothetical protein